MRILLLNALYPTPMHPKVVGGAERSVRNLAEALVAHGHDVEVIRAAAPSGVLTREVVNGVVVYAAPSKNLYWPFDGKERSPWLKFLWHLIDDWGCAPPIVTERLREFKPDVMHTNTLTGLTTNVWSLAKRFNVRVVHTLRDYYLICPRSKYYKNGSNCDGPCKDCSLLTSRRRQKTRVPDAVVGNSLATLNLHTALGLFGGARIRTAIGSLEESGARPLPPRDRSGDSKLLFGYIGRVTEEKGVEQLAKAYGLLPQGSAGLVIAGEGDAGVQDRLMRLSGGREINFMGFVPPREFYEAVDIVVAPSLWHEPLPRSVIDAISYARPVIGSNRGGTPEAMGEPPYGWIYDPSEEDGLLKALEASLAGGLPVLERKREDNLLSYLRVYSDEQ
ncbi:glycosyltransferase family 4 protein [Caulobacter sp. BP25]|uniref:glycosyltransferase family 4 protein n=1 Tax=Caulobacter sp. BP25 TaxID=2048900 RepID=UPI000C12D815|nr:glycosyltransferase family 4 protein [Caulobacter sp. BP25]PHY22897.1 glycosyl transferase [Caulobacter sp. BP25]